MPKPDPPFRIPLADFQAKVERERPDTLTAAEVAKADPNPWVFRAGNGRESSIRMPIGSLRYMRQPGSAVWHRVDGESDWAIMTDAA